MIGPVLAVGFARALEHLILAPPLALKILAGLVCYLAFASAVGKWIETPDEFDDLDLE